jgi:hypothetical protein
MNYVNLYGDTLINEYELQSVRALIMWAAEENKISEDTVREIIKTKFDADEITKLRRRDYDDAIRFLVDLQLEMVLN